MQALLHHCRPLCPDKDTLHQGSCAGFAPPCAGISLQGEVLLCKKVLCSDGPAGRSTECSLQWAMLDIERNWSFAVNINGQKCFFASGIFLQTI